MGASAAVLLGAGLLLMIVPPVARDGVCGLTSCADQVPPIAVTRVSPEELAVLVPDEAAASVRSVELLQGGNRGSGSRQWLIARDGAGTHSTFVIGAQPKGFRTVVPLRAALDKDVWTAQVGFRCTAASFPFTPATIAVGEVRSWDGVLDGTRFASEHATERCVTQRGSVEAVAFVAGAVLAVAGAVLGIVVVLRRPARFPEDGDDDGDLSDPTGPGDGTDGDVGTTADR